MGEVINLATRRWINKCNKDIRKSQSINHPYGKAAPTLEDLERFGFFYVSEDLADSFEDEFFEWPIIDEDPLPIRGRDAYPD